MPSIHAVGNWDASPSQGRTQRAEEEQLHGCCDESSAYHCLKIPRDGCNRELRQLRFIRTISDLVPADEPCQPSLVASPEE
jgi:hypothetical protein